MSDSNTMTSYIVVHDPSGKIRRQRVGRALVSAAQGEAYGGVYGTI